MVAVSSSRNPSSNRGRFSRSTKAAKPATSTTSTTSTADEQPHSNGTTRVEVVVVTPTKAGKRRRIEESHELENATGGHSSRDAAFITPTKRHSPSKNTAYLPTPPITPTISVSAAHEDEDDVNSQQLVSSPTEPIASTSASAKSSEKHVHANIYARARSLLRLSASAERLDESDGESQQQTHTQLVGREAERKQLNAFLSAHMPELFPGFSSEEEPAASTSTGPATRKDNPGMQPSKALYISGSPGTGKTALLYSIIANLRSRQSQRSRQAFNVALLNCTTVQRAEDIWARLAAELDLSLSSSTTTTRANSRKKSVSAVKVGWNKETFASALLEEADEKRLVVLDEIDHLLPECSTGTPISAASTSSPSNVLSDLFRLAMDPDSPLVLVGIANALDLTQRYRALLFGEGEGAHALGYRDGAGCGPQLLHFRPFQSDEMVSIVKQRLQSLHTSYQPNTPLSSSSSSITTSQAPSVALPLPIVMPAALELAAKKVAAVTGDLRAFLSLVRKAVEIFEAEQRKRFLELEKTSITARDKEEEEADDSPTKKRKLSSSTLSNSKSRSPSRQWQEQGYTDPLARFDAFNAPKLTPAHILKATRAVSLSSSSAASHSSSSSNNNGSMNSSSSAGALSAASSNQSTLLQAKIGELNLHQRVALTAFLILLARRISASVPAWALGWAGNGSSDKSAPQQQQQQQQHIDIDVEASSVPNGGARPSELHALYKALLEKEDLLQPVSSSEFSDLLSGLHTRGLVGLEREMARFGASSSSSSPTTTGVSAGLAPPMIRRTSSSSSVGSNGAGSSLSGSGRASRSPSPNTAAGKNGAQAPLYLLYPFTALHSVLAPAVPATSASPHSSTAITTTSESASICANLLNKESKRLRRIQKMNSQLEIERKERELAPRAGFSGDGLDKGPVGGREYVGSKDRRGRREMAADSDDDEDDDEHEKREQREQKRAAEEDEAGLTETSASLRDAYGISADW